MQRREFISLIGSVAATWPFAVRAQQPTSRVVGFIRSAPAATSMHLVAAFRKGLAEAGFVEGKDVAIELRFADDDFGRLPALATDLVRRGVAVIVGNYFAVAAIRAATTTIPVVFVGGGDPVRAGLVKSLNKPSANITGVTFLGFPFNGQAAAIAARARTKVRRYRRTTHPRAPEIASELREAKETARALGHDILVVQAGTASDLDAAFATIARARPAGCW